MSSCRSIAVVVVVLATLWGDTILSSASPQGTLVFGDSRIPSCNCVVLERCPSLRPQPNRRLTSEQIMVLRRARCGFEGRSIKVCCPDNVSGENPPTARPSSVVLLPGSCGFTSAFDRTFAGGTGAPLGGHPWMVALGYRAIKTGGSGLGVSVECGGSLVTTRHVITAAHCVEPRLLRRHPLVQLNIGDWNIATDPDCQPSQSSNIRVCAPPDVVRRPSLITVHPEYNTNGRHNNDIAVVQLDQAVTLGPFVQPICIPDSFDPRIRDPTEHSVPVATGWGIQHDGRSATILQEVRLPFVDIQVCNSSWLGLLGSGQVCAGGEPGKDTCGGDSGGPLITTGRFGPPFKLIGLTSFGRTLCGNEDNYGVYTSVPYFRDWILASLTE